MAVVAVDHVTRENAGDMKPPDATRVTAATPPVPATAVYPVVAAPDTGFVTRFVRTETVIACDLQAHELPHRSFPFAGTP
jgi:hypothetical protein